MKNIIYVLIIFFGVIQASLAQTPTDIFMMQKGQICIALPYQYESWDEYWEGTLLRENQNLGTVTSNSFMPMFALGLHNRLNVIASLPWIKREASAGTLHSESGIQDLSLWLKGLLVTKTIGDRHNIDVIASIGMSLPVGGYYSDYLPLSLGMGVNTFNTRLILDYRHESGLFASVFGGYDIRSNLETDRSNYFIDQHYLTNELYMPNVMTAGVTLGYFNELTKAELRYNLMNTDGGFDIRRNDMPFPSNNMDNGRVEVLFQQRMPFHKPLGIMVFGGYTTSGRNVGKSTSFGAGIIYLTNLWN